jgi:hypothetical protein
MAIRKIDSRGRCYDHNFLRFSPIFAEKFGVFLKNQCYDQIFAKSSSSVSKKRQYFRQIFRREHFKIITSVPGALSLEKKLSTEKMGSNPVILLVRLGKHDPLAFAIFFQLV